MMTPEEEASFRAAARRALDLARNVVMVAAEHPDEFKAFSLIEFTDGQAAELGENAVGIVIPAHWEGLEGAEEQCLAILRQESKALAGQALD